MVVVFICLKVLLSGEGDIRMKSSYWTYADLLFLQFPTTVASTSSTRTTRFSWPVSVARARPRVIFPVSVSRSSRSRVSVCLPCGRRRRRSPVRKQFSDGKRTRRRAEEYGFYYHGNERGLDECCWDSIKPGSYGSGTEMTQIPALQILCCYYD